MQQVSVDGLATLDVRIISSPMRYRRRREMLFRNALFNLRMIDQELTRMDHLLKSDLMVDADSHFAQIFFDVREDLSSMRFYLDCACYVLQVQTVAHVSRRMGVWLGEAGRRTITSLENFKKSEKDEK